MSIAERRSYTTARKRTLWYSPRDEVVITTNSKKSFRPFSPPQEEAEKRARREEAMRYGAQITSDKSVPGLAEFRDGGSRPISGSSFGSSLASPLTGAPAARAVSSRGGELRLEEFGPVRSSVFLGG